MLWAPAGAGDPLLAPLAVRNLNPFAQVQGLPAWSAPLAERGGGFALSADLASHFTRSRRGDEAVSLDGETLRAALRWERQASNRWRIGAELPWLVHGGGVLDGFIEGWHEFFGLPSLGRDRVPRGRLRLTYRRAGRTRVDIRSARNGPGDLGLYAVHRIDRHALAVRLKLPTGEAGDLLGSGAPALSAWWRGRWPLPRGALHAGAGGAWLGQGGVLPGRQRHRVAFGGVAAAWRVRPRLALKLQLDAHTALYRSALRELGDAVLQISAGGSIALGRGWYLDLAVVEDELRYDASPDVTFHLALRRIPVDRY